MTDTKKKLVATEEELKEAVDNAGESCQLFAQVEDLKLKYRQAEEAHVKCVNILYIRYTFYLI